MFSKTSTIGETNSDHFTVFLYNYFSLIYKYLPLQASSLRHILMRHLMEEGGGSKQFSHIYLVFNVLALSVCFPNKLLKKYRNGLKMYFDRTRSLVYIHAKIELKYV